ncbi:acyltransferase [Nonomuraea sp. NPDC003804]|uniref:acyltransferase family protein n=1 Tax=Nonomuraea sp. NPDC003804 TaxID=3154547 RepID=UPI0033A3DD34
MRFVAAFLVFFCHSSAQAFYADDELAEATMRVGIGFGWMGVAFFFVLSGFVLTWSARPEDSLTLFWRRRFFKIFPNHFVTWFAAVLLAIAAGEGFSVTQTGPSLVLVHAWVPDMEVINALHIPSWSLSCELLFYAAFPWLLRWVGRIRPAWLWASAGAVVVLIVAVPLTAQVLLPQLPRVPWFPMSVWHYWAVYTAPPVRLLEFVLGIIMARIVISGRWINLGRGPAFLTLAIGCVVQWSLVPSPWAMVAPTAVPLALLIAAAARDDARGRVTRLGSRPMIWLGNVSFAMYLLHLLVLHYGHLLLGPERRWSTLSAVGIQAALLLVTVALSGLLHRFVERPAMRRWSAPRRRERLGLLAETVGDAITTRRMS